MPMSVEEQNCAKNIATLKAALHLAKRNFKEFKSAMSGDGYGSSIQYERAQELAGRVFDLERSIRSEQANQRKWKSYWRKLAKNA